ncbi:holo-(acyl carrier protein) synthase 2 [Salmonella enterica subsp. enterica serovar Typhimurium str. DT104]|nr:holo-(acyl carrier protein) synthase 2 [Salmonella enterica subsp. enterica serovar Typhimurium str. DT104]
MYQVVLGKVSTLSAGQLPDALIAQAPQGVRRASWLAGRVLLSRALSPLPEMVYGEQGKPAFSAGAPLWFNLSHSGDTIALLLSDEGEVGWALLQRLAAVRGRLSLCADQAAAAKWWLSMPMASVSAEGPMPKALSTRRTSPLMPGCRHQGRACPLRRARMTSNPLIVA